MNLAASNIAEIWFRNYNNKFFNPIVPAITDFLTTTGHLTINGTLSASGNLTGRLLDIGCGDGEKTNLFRLIGFDVTAIDYDAAMLQKARQSYPDIDFIQFEIAKTLPFPDQSFDVVFSFSVFQYIDHQAIFRECRRILKHGGCLILIANLQNNPFIRLSRFFSSSPPISSPPSSNLLNYYTPHQFTALKAEFASSSISFHHILTPLAHLRIFRKLLPLFAHLDKLLLKIPIMRRFCWLGLLTAKKMR
jgi:SAM-dependent methyltransferase